MSIDPDDKRRIEVEEEDGRRELAGFKGRFYVREHQTCGVCGRTKFDEPCEWCNGKTQTATGKLR